MIQPEVKRHHRTQKKKKNIWGSVTARVIKMLEVCGILLRHASKRLRRRERKAHLIKKSFPQWAVF